MPGGCRLEESAGYIGIGRRVRVSLTNQRANEALSANRET